MQASWRKAIPNKEEPIRVLVADDQAHILEAVELLLRPQGIRVDCARSPQLLLDSLSDCDYDVLLIDLNYTRDTTSGEEGLDLLARIHDFDAGLPVIVMTAWGNIDLAVECIKRGARDFIQKPWENERLLSLVRIHAELHQALRRARQLEMENRLLRADGMPEFVAGAPAMQPVLDLIAQIGPSDANVLITGEHGTGKEIVAKLLHAASPRARMALVAVNAGGLPEGTFESEIFGHVKGAFTDARADRVGRFELANGGTLFLDEIGDMPLSMQAKLLRVLQEREVERVGGTKAIKLDARVVTATNKDLEELCAGGQFRSDLYYRLNIVSLNIPPLRERRDDIPLLCEMLLRKINLKLECFIDTISPECMTKLTAYSWPGNVRELENALERAVNIMDEGVCILREHLPRAILTSKCNGAEEPIHRDDLVEAKQDIEKKAIMKALAAADGNKSKAALLLCMNRSVFYERLRKYNIGTKNSDRH